MQDIETLYRKCKTLGHVTGGSVLAGMFPAALVVFAPDEKTAWVVVPLFVLYLVTVSVLGVITFIMCKVRDSRLRKGCQKGDPEALRVQEWLNQDRRNFLSAER